MKYDNLTMTSKKVNYILEGDGDLTVILVHGIPSSLTEWETLSQVLLSNNYGVGALDLLGHGDSYKPAESKNYTVDNAYIFFKSWLTSLQIKTPIVLLGHSFGGYLCIRYALDNPDQVCGLILIDPFLSFDQISAIPHFFLSYPKLASLFIRLVPLWFIKLMIWAENLTIKNFRLESILPRNKIIRMAIDYKRCSPNVVYFPKFISDKLINYSELQMPTLLIWGNKDTTLSMTWFEKLAENIPNLTLHLLNAGHYPHHTNVEVNTYIIEFLSTSIIKEKILAK